MGKITPLTDVSRHRRSEKPAALVYGTLVQPKVLGRENTSTSLDKRVNGITQVGHDQPDGFGRAG